MSEEQTRNRMEMYAALLMGAAALATSWVGYQSSRWSGRQLDGLHESSDLRIAGSQRAAEAMQLEAVDVGLFTNWVNAYASGDRVLDGFYRARFRPEFRPAFEAWIAQKPLRNPDAAPSPFSLPVYRLQSREEARQLEDASEAKYREAQAADDTEDKYIANAVIMAMALFFTGMSRYFPTLRIQAAMLILSALMCLLGLAFILRLPVLL